LSLIATVEQKDKEIAELRAENALLREKNLKLEKKVKELTDGQKL
jgi:cell division protein FtsB